MALSSNQAYMYERAAAEAIRRAEAAELRVGHLSIELDHAQVS